MSGVSKKRNREIIIFTTLFVVYNILVFVIPFKRTSLFAITYVFALISIVVFAASYFYAIGKPKTLKSKFLSFPIFYVGFIYMAAQIVISTIFMILTSFFTIGTWVAVVPCLLMLAAAIILMTSVDAAKATMEDTAIRHEINTSFISGLKVDLKALANRVSDEILKERLFNLSEAVRYSDPVSNSALAEIEAVIKTKFEELKSIIDAGDSDAEARVDEISNLLYERNEKCKASKKTV